MADVQDNDVVDALGVGIFCGDYSMCRIEENSVSGTRPDMKSGDRTRMGLASSRTTVPTRRLVTTGWTETSIRSRVFARQYFLGVECSHSASA